MDLCCERALPAFNYTLNSTLLSKTFKDCEFVVVDAMYICKRTNVLYVLSGFEENVNVFVIFAMGS